jgi:hypothetical protein
MLTKEQTDALRLTLKDLTPGPWEADHHGLNVVAPDPYGKGRMQVADIRGWGHLTGQGTGACKLTDEEGSAIQDANMIFIVEARNNFEALLDMVDQLREAIATCQCGSGG